MILSRKEDCFFQVPLKWIKVNYPFPRDDQISLNSAIILVNVSMMSLASIYYKFYLYLSEYI